VDEDRESVTPSEAARDRRRDRRTEAGERTGMNTGLAKQFKQVLDLQVKRGAEAEREMVERATAGRKRVAASGGGYQKDPSTGQPQESSRTGRRPEQARARAPRP
jgi:hypothetical protein